MHPFETLFAGLGREVVTSWSRCPRFQRGRKLITLPTLSAWSRVGQVTHGVSVVTRWSRYPRCQREKRSVTSPVPILGAT